MSFEIPDFKSSEPGNGLRIIFVHHSTGRRLIQQGEVRQLIFARNEKDGTNHELWDHDYNRIGLVDPKGNRLGVSFNIPDDNTDPDGLDVLFSQPVSDPPVNALSKLMVFDVIIFKSCFPVSAIRSESQLARYKDHYHSVRRTLASYPSRLFICMTPPPLIPLRLPVIAPVWTNPMDARRARKFALWLASEDFIQGLPNIKVFDFFDCLAGYEDSGKSANMLRKEYRGIFGLDSHPNKKANRAVAPLFVNFIWDSIKEFSAAEKCHTVQLPTAAPKPGLLHAG